MRNDDSIAIARKELERVIRTFEGVACTTHGYGLVLQDAIKRGDLERAESKAKKAVRILIKDILELHRTLYGKPIQRKYLNAVNVSDWDLVIEQFWKITQKVYDVLPSLRDNLKCGAWDQVRWDAEITFKWLKSATKDLYRYLTGDETADPYN